MSFICVCDLIVDRAHISLSNISYLTPPMQSHTGTLFGSYLKVIKRISLPYFFRVAEGTVRFSMHFKHYL